MENISGYAPIFFISLVSIILLRSILSTTRSKLRLPPSPWALPIIGHLHLLQKPLHRCLQNLSDRYGPLIHIYLGSLPVVVVSSAELAKEILKTHELSFCNRSANAAIRYLTYDAADLGFSPYGTYWKFMKKLCMSELLNGRMLDQLSAIRQEEISQFLQKLKRKGEAGEAVNVGAEALQLTNSIIMRMSTGKSLFQTQEEAREVIRRVKDGSELCSIFNLSDYFWFCKNLDLQGIGKRLKEVRDKFDFTLENIIKEHEEARNKSAAQDKDILDVLLSISEDESSEVKITKNNIKGFLMDILTGGTDTSAVTIEWAMAELIKQPEAMEKARKEIDSVIGRNRVVMESDMADLPYIEAVVKETLRLHSPSPLMIRESVEKCSVGGYDIPENTQVFINVWAIGRNAKYWENPLEFRPERFLSRDGNGKEMNLEVRGQHYQLLPFGSGRRGCPGASLALHVVQTTLAAMIQCFEWKDADGGNGCLDMTEGPE
ncbi:hypothetical protein K1719_006923 [Acacia pycnantha]|nr:hypothetical protein K1719_006923 [Acacia pycnantha]